ncbi:MAG: hypothetical protein U0L45_02805 [Alistipes sp.]|nr:hypothetical protein [Alistipes sp.]
MPEITLSDDITINETLVFEPKTRAAVTEALAEARAWFSLRMLRLLQLSK